MNELTSFPSIASDHVNFRFEGVISGIGRVAWSPRDPIGRNPESPGPDVVRDETSRTNACLQVSTAENIQMTGLYANLNMNTRYSTPCFHHLVKYKSNHPTLITDSNEDELLPLKHRTPINHYSSRYFARYAILPSHLRPSFFESRQSGIRGHSWDHLLWPLPRPKRV